MSFTEREILETIRMVALETLDIRTTTLGINLLDCADPDLEATCEKVYAKIVQQGEKLVSVADSISADYGVPIVNKRIAVTPISWLVGPSGATDLVPVARALDIAAEEVGVDFIGGFSAYVHKGFTRADDAVFTSIPAALAERDEHGIVEHLSGLGLLPLCAQNIEHMLCEWRKMALPDGRRARGEPSAGYAELWRAVAPVIARRAAL